MTNIRIESAFGITFADVLEAADHARRKRHHVERAEIDIFDLAVLVFPARTPGAGHRDEGLVGVVVVHHRAVAGPGLAVAEVEALADLDGGEPRRVVADRRGHRPAAACRRLEADDVEQRALAARHLDVRQAPVEALEVLEARHALHHFLAREIKSRKLFHGVLLGVLRFRPFVLINQPRGRHGSGSEGDTRRAPSMFACDMRPASPPNPGA